MPLKSTENRLIKIPDNGAYKLAALNGKAEVVAEAPEGFSEEILLEQIKKAPKAEPTTDENPQKEDEASQKVVGKSFEEKISTTSSLFHETKEKFGTTYITLIANEPLKVIARQINSKEKAIVEVTDVASKEKQTLFTFEKSEEPVKEETQGQEEPVEEESPLETNSNEPEEKEGKEDSGHSPLRAGDKFPIKIIQANIDPNDVIDGTGNFDRDNEPGHDNGPKNKVVRSFDSISYKLKFSTRTADSGNRFTDVRYTVTVRDPKAVAIVDGQKIRHYYIQDGTLSGSPTSDEQEAKWTYQGVFPTSDAAADFPFTAIVEGAPNGYVVQPEVTITFESAINQRGERVYFEENNVIPVEVPKVTVSSKVSLTAFMGTDEGRRSSYDKIANVKGSSSYGQLFAVSLAVTPLKDGSSRGGSDYRGVAFPQGTITGNIGTKIDYSDDYNPSLNHVLSPSEQEQPKVINYGLIDQDTESTEKFTLTPEFSNVQLKPQSAKYTVPNAVYSKLPYGQNQNSAVDSGEFSLKNTGNNQLEFSFVKPAAYRHATRYIDDKTSIAPETRYFASGFAIMKLPFAYLSNHAKGSLRESFIISSVSYTENGKTVTQPVSSQADTTIGGKPDGVLNYHTVWKGSEGGNLGSSTSPTKPAGDEKTYVGSDITLNVMASSNSFDTEYQEYMTVWNGNTAELKGAPHHESSGAPYSDYEYVAEQFGVLKNGSNYPGLDTNLDEKRSRYDWYDTFYEAKKKGTVTGFYYKIRKIGLEQQTNMYSTFQFKVKSTKIGEKDADGNPNVAYTIGRIKDWDDKTLASYPSSEMGNFRPTVYNPNGTIQSNQNPQTTYGDTLYIVPMMTRITLDVDNNSDSFNVINRPLKYMVSLSVRVGDDDDYMITTTAYLPKGVKYKKGSTKAFMEDFVDHREPTITENADGTSKLIWKVKYNRKIWSNPDFTSFDFEAEVDPSLIQFASGNRTYIKAKSTVEGEKIADPRVKDADDISQRTSEIGFYATKINEVGISFSALEKRIDAGNNDPAIVDKTDSDGMPLRLDDIHYNMKAINFTNNYLGNARLLNVLPQQGDGEDFGRDKTTFSGDYQLLNAKFATSNTNATIYYTTSRNFTAKTDPNMVNMNGDWIRYNNNSKQKINNVRAIMVVANQLLPNQTISLDYTVVPNRPAGDSDGNSFSNNMRFNSSMNLALTSPQENTEVFGRTLSGIAWYDDNSNGAYDLDWNGDHSNDEEKMPNVPVRIYRKSNDFNETTYKLLEQNLAGESLLNTKTDSDGNYKFKLLPEGDYKVEFQFDANREFHATTKDTTYPYNPRNMTSKIDELSTAGIATAVGFTGPPTEVLREDNKNILNVNAGVLRKGIIEVYKVIDGIFETTPNFTPVSPELVNSDGSVANKDATLKGAVFELHQVVMDAGSEKILEDKKIAELTTDENGKASYELHRLVDEKDEYGNTPLNNRYQLIEVSAPYGYEILEEPVYVYPRVGKTKNEFEYFNPSKVYVPNKPVPETELPYTGTNHIMQSILIIAGSIFLMALFFVGFNLFRLDDGWNGGK